MDPLAIVVTVSALYLLLCILVSLFIDADATTFLYSKLGPPVSRQLAGRCVCRVYIPACRVCKLCRN